MRARYACECACECVCEYLCECRCACARVRVQDANSAQGQHSDAQAHRHTRMRTRAYARARPRARVQTQALTGTLRGACLRGIRQSERAPLAMSPCEEPMRPDLPEQSTHSLTTQDPRMTRPMQERACMKAGLRGKTQYTLRACTKARTLHAAHSPGVFCQTVL